MSASFASDRRMTVEEYLDGCETRPDEERNELIDGVPVALAGDSLRHNLTQFALARALQDAVTEAGLPCFVFVDGVNVKINTHKARIPDCSVQCGPRGDLDAMLVEPVVLAEVTSLPSAKDDSGAKLSDCFAVPSVGHDPIVRADQGVVVDHRWLGEDDTRTALVRAGRPTLEPPGLSLDVDPVLRAAPPAPDAEEARR